MNDGEPRVSRLHAGCLCNHLPVSDFVFGPCVVDTTDTSLAVHWQEGIEPKFHALLQAEIHVIGSTQPLNQLNLKRAWRHKTMSLDMEGGLILAQRDNGRLVAMTTAIE